MDVTVEELERIKGNFDAFEEFAALMFELIGHLDTEFEEFCQDLNQLLVDLAVGPDSQPQIATRVQYLFIRRVRQRKFLQRRFGDGRVASYGRFLKTVDHERGLGLSRRDIRALTNRHMGFLREFIARYPGKSQR